MFISDPNRIVRFQVKDRNKNRETAAVIAAKIRGGRFSLSTDPSKV